MRSRWDGVDWEMYLFPALRYHERWEDLSEGDFDRTLGPARYKSFRKGSSMYTKAQLKANAKFRVMSDAFAQEINLEYMEKIWELCEENSVQLMLLLSPNLRVYPEIISEVQKFADAHDLNFLYYGTKEEVLELGLKPERDFYDKVHLNIWGQRIYSGIMANYIQEHYSLESHKDDSSIRESWDQSYQDYLEFYDEISEKNKK